MEFFLRDKNKPNKNFAILYFEIIMKKAMMMKKLWTKYKSKNKFKIIRRKKKKKKYSPYDLEE